PAVRLAATENTKPAGAIRRVFHCAGRRSLPWTAGPHKLPGSLLLAPLRLHLYPGAFLMRTGHGVDGPLDFQPFLEVDQPGRGIAADAADELAAFDDLEFVKAETMAGSRDERIVGLVLRADKHRAIALLGGAVRGDIKLELVGALLVKQDGTARAEDLQGDAALAAPGGTVDQKRAGHAVLQPHQHACNVPGLDSPPASGGQRPVCVRLGHVADHSADATEQHRNE